MGKLFWKIFLGFWVTLIAIALGVGMTVHWNAQQQAEAGSNFINKQGVGFMLNSASDAIERGGEKQLHKLLTQWRLDTPPPFLIVNEHNQELFNRPLPRRVHHRIDKLWSDSPLPPHVKRVRAPFGEQYLILMVPRTLLNHAQRKSPPWMHVADPLRLRLWVTLVGSILFSAALAWTITHPVRELQRTVKSFASGDLSARSSQRLSKRRDEIGDLHREFNSMAANVQRLVETQNHLFHDVSHEIRSPLARLSVALGLIDQSSEKQDTLIARMRREIDRMDELIEEILSLSKLSSVDAAAQFSTIELGDLLQDIVDEYLFDAQQSNKLIEYSSKPSVSIKGDANLLQRAFGNLVKNALSYTPQGSTVEIELHRSTHGQAVVQVTDQGEGVEEDELEMLFQPFYRGRTSQHAAGFGLGLAVTQRTIQLHKGQMNAENLPNGGLRITIKLPIAQTQ